MFTITASALTFYSSYNPVCVSSYRGYGPSGFDSYYADGTNTFGESTRHQKWAEWVKCRFCGIRSDLKKLDIAICPQCGGSLDSNHD